MKAQGRDKRGPPRLQGAERASRQKRAGVLGVV